MKNKKKYHVKLHADGFKHTNKFSGFDSANAYFSTNAEASSEEFNKAMDEAVFFTGDQEVSHGWKGWTVGKLFVEDGRKPVSVMSPAWEYRTEATMTTPVWKEV
jgi:hypothetical protein